MTPPAIDMSSTTPTTAEDNKPNAAFRVGLGDVTINNLGQLKRLNTVLFPITYANSFYKEVLEVGEFAKISTCLTMAEYGSYVKQWSVDMSSHCLVPVTWMLPSILFSLFQRCLCRRCVLS